jgi:hypothetical protein
MPAGVLEIHREIPGQSAIVGTAGFLRSLSPVLTPISRSKNSVPIVVRSPATSCPVQGSGVIDLRVCDLR